MSNSFKNPAVDRFRNSRGQDVPVDTFLYACLEAEQTIKATSAKGQRPIQWPNLQDLSPKDLKDELDAQELRDILEDLLSWYAANYPDLATSAAWDYGVVSTVVQPLVCLSHDLNHVHEIKYGERLPEYVQDAEVNQKVWALIKSLIDRFFNSKSSYINRYIEWSFGKARELDGDEASRPPVGRFSPGAQRHRQQREQRERRPEPRPEARREATTKDIDEVNGNTDRPPRPDQHRRKGGGRGDHRPQGQHDRQGRNDRRPDHRRNGGGPRRHQDTNPELEAAAIQECNEAFAFLQSNPQEEKVILKPQNSFYRRIQHQVIVSNDYDSESTGEGNERSVVVWRKKR